MRQIVELNPAYSTTRRLRIAAPEAVNAELQALQKSEDKFETNPILPEGEERKGEGGLRTRGYYKDHIDGKPLITVITVVFNGEKHLEDTIRSIISQTYENIEYVIVDGGSSDRTLDIIEKYEYTIDYWVSEKDNGIYDAMNKGLHLAMGEWVNFMNADDYFFSVEVVDRVAKEVRNLEKNFSIVYGPLNLISDSGVSLDVISTPSDQAKSQMSHRLSIPHQSQFSRLSAIKEIGFFDNTYRVSGDYEFTIRLLKNYECYFIGDLMVACMRTGGISSNPKISLLLLREDRRSQVTHGYKLNRFFIYAGIRVCLRLITECMFGRRLTYRLLDYGNKILGRTTYWTER